MFCLYGSFLGEEVHCQGSQVICIWCQKPINYDHYSDNTVSSVGSGHAKRYTREGENARDAPAISARRPCNSRESHLQLAREVLPTISLRGTRKDRKGFKEKDMFFLLATILVKSLGTLYYFAYKLSCCFTSPSPPPIQPVDNMSTLLWGEGDSGNWLNFATEWNLASNVSRGVLFTMHQTVRNW